MAEELKPHENPPLAKLNDSYRKDDAERRAEVDDALQTAQAAMASALSVKGRRLQKPLRPQQER